MKNSTSSPSLGIFLTEPEQLGSDKGPYRLTVNDYIGRMRPKSPFANWKEAEEALPLNRPTVWMHEGRQLLLLRTEERVLLLPPRCPHQGAPLEHAWTEGPFLVCARHRYVYSLEDGFCTQREGGRVFLRELLTKLTC